VPHEPVPLLRRRLGFLPAGPWLDSLPLWAPLHLFLFTVIIVIVVCAVDLFDFIVVVVVVLDHDRGGGLPGLLGRCRPR
jgi:hypothetical protein